MTPAASDTKYILVVEDEAHIAAGLRFNLEAEGYHAEVLDNAEDALDRLRSDPHAFDVVLLDVMLPGMDGFTLTAELRRQQLFVPVMMLTARGRPDDVLRGFEAGADDYLPKPFELAILLARLRGLLRRQNWSRHAPAVAPTAAPPPEIPDLYEFSGKVIDFANLELRAGERRVPLTLMEANLLRHLVKYEGKAVSRKSILVEVWGVRDDTDTRAIDNFIVRLRRYVEADPSNPRHLLSVRGVGYRFVASPPEE